MPVLDLEHLASIELPTPDEEIWRYSRIADLDLAAYRPAAHAPDVSGPTEYVELDGPTSTCSPTRRPTCSPASTAAPPAQVRIVVPAGVTVDETISITHTIGGDGGSSARGSSSRPVRTARSR